MELIVSPINDSPIGDVTNGFSLSIFERSGIVQPGVILREQFCGGVCILAWFCGSCMGGAQTVKSLGFQI